MTSKNDKAKGKWEKAAEDAIAQVERKIERRTSIYDAFRKKQK